MNIVKKIITIIITSITILSLSGCFDEDSPTKIGGGGKQQTYNPSNGRYN